MILYFLVLILIGGLSPPLSPSPPGLSSVGQTPQPREEQHIKLDLLHTTVLSERFVHTLDTAGFIRFIYSILSCIFLIYKLDDFFAQMQEKY